MKWIYILLFTFYGFLSFGQVSANEVICSDKYKFCFQIPPNQYMLSDGDIESEKLSYKNIDGKSKIDIENGNIEATTNFHALFLKIVDNWKKSHSRVNLKKELPESFVISGFTQQGRGFYQKYILNNKRYTSVYFEFPKPAKKYAAISQMIHDYFMVKNI
ncbi:MAG: hypothetical protein KA198_06900 [Chitinophagaceae bacterium]|jgi:hypothetical protein|nr:hypothetical protein [Chitinophagaceae bacterium]